MTLPVVAAPMRRIAPIEAVENQVSQAKTMTARNDRGQRSGNLFSSP